MGVITKEMVELIYAEGIKFYNDELGREEAIKRVMEKTLIGKASCNAYLCVLCGMLDGVEYRRTANAYATEYFLTNIEKDFGIERRKKAASAVMKHANYYATLGHGHQRKIEELAKRYQ